MDDSRPSTPTKANKRKTFETAMDGSKSWSRRTLFDSLKTKILRPRPSIKDITDPPKYETLEQEGRSHTPTGESQTLSLGSLGRSSKRRQRFVLDNPTTFQELQDSPAKHRRSTSRSDAIKRLAASTLGRKSDHERASVFIKQLEQFPSRLPSTIALEAPSVDIDIPTGDLDTFDKKDYDIFSDTILTSMEPSTNELPQRSVSFEVHHSSPVAVPAAPVGDATCVSLSAVAKTPLCGSEAVLTKKIKEDGFVVGSVPSATPMLSLAARMPGRKSSAKHPPGKLELSLSLDGTPQALPTPMPGTMLPLEDPFEDTDTAPNESGAMHVSEASAGTNSPLPTELSAQTNFSDKLQALKDPDAGHVDHKTGIWTSDDPFGPAVLDGLSEVSTQTSSTYDGPVLERKPRPSPRVSSHSTTDSSTEQSNPDTDNEYVGILASRTSRDNLNGLLQTARKVAEACRAASSTTVEASFDTVPDLTPRARKSSSLRTLYSGHTLTTANEGPESYEKLSARCPPFVSVTPRDTTNAVATFPKSGDDTLQILAGSHPLVKSEEPDTYLPNNARFVPSPGAHAYLATTPIENIPTPHPGDYVKHRFLPPEADGVDEATRLRQLRRAIDPYHPDTPGPFTSNKQLRCIARLPKEKVQAMIRSAQNIKQGWLDEMKYQHRMKLTAASEGDGQELGVVAEKKKTGNVTRIKPFGSTDSVMVEFQWVDGRKGSYGSKGEAGAKIEQDEPQINLRLRERRDSQEPIVGPTQLIEDEPWPIRSEPEENRARCVESKHSETRCHDITELSRAWHRFDSWNTTMMREAHMDELSSMLPNIRRDDYEPFDDERLGAATPPDIGAAEEITEVEWPARPEWKDLGAGKWVATKFARVGDMWVVVDTKKADRMADYLAWLHAKSPVKPVALDKSTRDSWVAKTLAENY